MKRKKLGNQSCREMHVRVRCSDASVPNQAPKWAKAPTSGAPTWMRPPCWLLPGSLLLSSLAELEVLSPPVWESAARREAPRAEQGKVPHAAVMKARTWNPADIKSAPWDLHELPQPSHRLHPTAHIRKLLASTSQHRNTHKHEPPEKGAFPLCITQKSVACKGGRALQDGFFHSQRDALHWHPFVQRLGWKKYKRVPSTLKIPAVDLWVLLTLLKAVCLFPIKGFPTLFVFGGSLGEHNHCQTHSNLSIPFPKGYQISSKWATEKPCIPPREKPELLCD